MFGVPVDVSEHLAHERERTSLPLGIELVVVHAEEELHEIRHQINPEERESIPQVVHQATSGLLRECSVQIRNEINPYSVREQLMVREEHPITCRGEHVLHPVRLELDLIPELLERDPERNLQSVHAVTLELDDFTCVRRRPRIRLRRVDRHSPRRPVFRQRLGKLCLYRKRGLHGVAVQQNLIVPVHQRDDVPDTGICSLAPESLIVSVLYIPLERITQTDCLCRGVVRDVAEFEEVGELLRLKHRLDLTLHLCHLLRPTGATKAPIGVDRNEPNRERHRLTWVPGDPVRRVLCDVQRSSGVRQERHHYVSRVFGMCGKKRGLTGSLRLVAVGLVYRLVQVPAASDLGVSDAFEVASQHVTQFARTCQVGQGDGQSVAGQHRQPFGSKIECLLQITQILHELRQPEVHEFTWSCALVELWLGVPLLVWVETHLGDHTGGDITIQLPAPELQVVPCSLLSGDGGCFLKIPEHDVRDRLVCLAQRPEEGHKCCKVEPRSFRLQRRGDLGCHR